MKASSTTTVVSHQPRGLPDQVAPGWVGRREHVPERVHGTHGDTDGHDMLITNYPPSRSPTTSPAELAELDIVRMRLTDPRLATRTTDHRYLGRTQSRLKRESGHPRRLSGLTGAVGVLGLGALRSRGLAGCLRRW
jgi:hypothetical protein